MKTEIKVILPFETEGEYFVEKLGEIEKKPVFDFTKRLFDIVVSFVALIVLFLPMLIITIMIKSSSKGSVFYTQERLGLNGKKIQVVKFRTMYSNAEEFGAKWSDGDDDERIFPFGKVLRKFRLDELPQFFNVLGGSMSLVGPRPERPCFYEAFETYIHGFSQRLVVKPGITGLAQVNGGYSIRPEEKILHDIEYIKKRSLWLDFKILLKTVGIVLHHRDAK